MVERCLRPFCATLFPSNSSRTLQRSCTMRLLLGLALILLSLWLLRSQVNNNNNNVNNNIPCESVSASDSTVSLLLSPLSLYSWLTSTLLRLVLSLPGLTLSVLHQSLLLLVAGPWCVASISLSLALTVLRVSLYLLHLALVLGVVAVLSVSKSHFAKDDAPRRCKAAASRAGHQG